jgi:hypothetical protein
MKKQILTMAIAGALTVAGAGLAFANCAATTPLAGDSSCADFNVYGASAEFNFFANEAQPFLANGLGCTDTTFNGGVPANEGTKEGVFIGHHCLGGSTTVVYRFASKASWDGIVAITGENPLGQYTNYAGDVDSNGSAATGVAGGCQTISFFERTFIDESSCPGGGTACTKLLCATVNIGAADVAASEFAQSSQGRDIIGPKGNTSYTGVPSPLLKRTFPNGVATGTGNNALVDNKVFVVPFSFYVNKAVTVNKCLGSATLADNGQFCKTSADCSGGATCTTEVLDNISHPMAVQIFSGSADNWQDFGPWFVNLPMDVCLRHAGSGSHATLDWTVMRGTSLTDSGANTLALLAQAEGGPGDSASTTGNAAGGTSGLEGGGGNLWFNDGTGDNLTCANRWTATTAPVGSITYADSDVPAYSANASKLTNLQEVKYNGEWGRHAALVNGMYDFYTTEHLYTSVNSTAGVQGTIFNDLLTYAQGNPANLPAIEANYWALPCQMAYDKANMLQYPGIIGATCAQDNN